VTVFEQHGRKEGGVPPRGEDADNRPHGRGTPLKRAEQEKGCLAKDGRAREQRSVRIESRLSSVLHGRGGKKEHCGEETPRKLKRGADMEKNPVCAGPGKEGSAVTTRPRKKKIS